MGLKSLVASPLFILALLHAHCEPASDPVAGDTGRHPLSECRSEPSVVAECLQLFSHASGRPGESVGGKHTALTVRK